MLRIQYSTSILEGTSREALITSEEHAVCEVDPSMYSGRDEKRTCVIRVNRSVVKFVSFRQRTNIRIWIQRARRGDLSTVHGDAIEFRSFRLGWLGRLSFIRSSLLCPTCARIVYCTYRMSSVPARSASRAWRGGQPAIWVKGIGRGALSS